MRRRVFCPLIVALGCWLWLAAPAFACSKDDTNYFDGFLDTSCLETPLSNTTLDTFGGLRLTTNGTPVATTWETASDFDNGISWQLTPFPPVGVRTLATDSAGGTGPGRLVLPDVVFPLARDTAANAYPGISTAAPTTKDSDNVDDPAVVYDSNVAGGPFVMYYSGTAEDGTGPAIFQAVSTDGVHWNRANSGNPVMEASADATAFDSRGVAGPDVVYDPSDSSAPLKMWYSGIGDVFGAIGYATSTDGINWTRFDDPDTTATDDPVLDHGSAGSPDSFAAADPSVLKDGATWKMWYTGDDSNKKRIAYATSPDGVNWTKGGKVISPEDPGANANYQFGAFAPTVWKTDSGFDMLLAGRKNIGTATAPVFQTRIMNASSTDGLDWTAPSPEINPQASRFYASNLNAPFVLPPPTSGDPYRLWFSGNSIDGNGNFHTRIGYGTSPNGNSFSPQAGPGSLNCGQCVLDIGLLSTSFDARQASGLSAAAPGSGSNKFAGFYWGTRGSDFKPRLGEANSADGSTWTKVSVSSPAGGAVFPLGGTFDVNGDRDPGVLYDGGNYDLYFTAIDGSGVRSIGMSSTAENATTHQPDNSSWSARSQIVQKNTGFDASGVSHPSVIKDGANYVMWYTGTASGVTAIGRMVSASASFTSPTARAQVTFTGTATCDPDGMRDPVVIKPAASDYRMLYTGIEKLEGQTIERGCFATSSDGITWAREGFALDPSQTAYSSDEVGVEPTGMLVDGSTVHVWYSGVNNRGRTLGDHATAAFAAAPLSAQPGLGNGWATYQVGNEATDVQDWRQIIRTSTSTSTNGVPDVQLWMSFEQPYSTGGAGNQFWSAWFPVTVSATSEQLKFLLTVRGVRWQARVADPGNTPSLDTVEIDHAAVSFNSSGNAVTKEIGPPSGQTLTNWRTLTVSSSLFQPTGGGTGSGTVTVLSADQAQQLASAALNTGGDTSIDLSGISASDHPTLRVRLDLASDGTASPLVTALKVAYFTNLSAPVVVTLAASPTTIQTGQSATLTGNVSKAGSPLANEAVTLLQQTGGGAFGSFATATTDGSGNFSLAVSPTVTTTYEASDGSATSAPVTVTVQQPPTLTLTATPAQIIFGQTATLSGNLSRGGAPLAAQAVSLLQQPAGAPALAPFGNAATDAAGNWSSVVTPQLNTTYQAAFGASSSPTAAVGVHQRVTLKASRKLATATFKGTIAPAHPSRDVLIQLKKGTSFVTFAKAKTGATSAFSVKKELKPCGKFQFRAVTAADADHLDGTSAIALVERHRISIKVSVKGRKITIIGKVAPAHKSGTVLVKEIKGTRAVKLGKAKITKKSTFRFVIKLKKGTHKLRADMPADKCHFAGSSAVKAAKLH